jgi:hypothetical protein
VHALSGPGSGGRDGALGDDHHVVVVVPCFDEPAATSSSVRASA